MRGRMDAVFELRDGRYEVVESIPAARCPEGAVQPGPGDGQ